MSEIKTLEHYVVARIERLEDENEELKLGISTVQGLNNKLVEDLEFIKNVLSPHMETVHSEYYSKDRKYIDFSTVWDNNENFDKLVAVLGVTDDTSED